MWAILEGSGSLRSPILGGRWRRPPTTVGWQKTRRIALSCSIKNITGRFFVLVTKHACDRRTDGRTVTDEQNYDSQDRARIAASRGKIVFIECLLSLSGLAIITRIGTLYYTRDIIVHFGYCTNAEECCIHAVCMDGTFQRKKCNFGQYWRHQTQCGHKNK